MNIIYLILVIVFTIGLFIFPIWYSKKCNNHIDYIINGQPHKQLLLLMGIVVVAIIYIFIIANLIVRDDQTNLLLKIYSLFTQTSGVDNIPDPVSFKFFSLIVSFVGSIIFSGLLISTFNNMLQVRIKNVNNGNIRYKTLKNHDIIIGSNDLTGSVIRYLIYNNKNRIAPNSRIIILSNHTPEDVKLQLGYLDESTKRRIIIYHGNMFDEAELKNICLEKSNRIIILGDENITKCDSCNILILDKIVNIFNSLSIVKNCYISFWDDFLLLKYCHDLHTYSSINILPFNFYEMWASKVWGYGHFDNMLRLDNKEFQYQSLTQNRITPVSNTYVNIIILGLNTMGIELLKMAIKICHYANYNELTGENKTKITIISDNKNAINTFKTRYPNLEFIPDIECDFKELSPFEKNTQQIIVDLLDHQNAISYIAVCSDDYDENYMLATHLPLNVYEKNIPIIVEYNIYSEYIEKIHTDKKKYENIRFFGFKNATINIDAQLELSQFISQTLDVLNEAKIPVYSKIPDIKFSKEEMEKSWNRYKIDNLRQTIIAYIDSLFSILDSRGLQLKEEPHSLDDYKIETLGDSFNYMKHRQMIAWNLLAGYLPTEDDNDWRIGKVNTLFPLSQLKNGSNGKENSIIACRYNQIALLLWLYENNYFLYEK